MSPRLLRRLCWALLFSVLAIAALGVGGNVYLNSEYLPKLIRSQQQGLRVKFTFAWSLWPGRLHFENLTVQREEHGLTWELTADRATLVADLSALTARQIDIEALELDGVRARIRPRLYYLDATPEYLATLPEIDEAGPQLFAEGPIPPPSLQSGDVPWSLRIERARIADLRELWVDRFHFIGHAEAEGSVRLDAARVVTTGPVRVSLREGEVSIDRQPTVRELHGSGTSQLGPVDLSRERGWRLLSTLSGSVTLEGQVMRVDFLPKLSGLPVPIVLEGAEGPARTTVSMRDGKVQPGAVLDWEAKNARAEVDGFIARGAMTLHTVVEESRGALRTHATASFDDFWLGRDGQPPFATAKRAVLEMFAPNVEMERISEFDTYLRAAFAQTPADLSVEGPRVLGQARALQWAATADRLTSKVDLSKAQARELTLLEPSAHGVRVWIRPRVEQAEATAAYLKYLPKTDGLGEPPIRPKTRPEPFEVRAAAERWSLSVQGASVDDLEEVWLEAYRFVGHAQAHGGFRYEAGGRFSAGPLSAEIADGTLQIARWRALSKLSGKIDARVDPIDLELHQGPAFFRTFRATSELSAHLDDVNFVRHFPAVPIPAELVGGQGGIRARVSLNDGVVQPGSTVQWETRSLQASVHGYRFVGPFSLEARWSDAPVGARMRVEGRVSPYRVTRVGEEKALVRGKLITWRMEAPTFDLAHPSFEPMTSAQIHGGTVPDLTEVNAFVPDNIPLRMEKGSGTFSGKVWFTHRYQAWAEFEVGGKSAQLVYDRVYVNGDWSCTAKLANVDLNTGAADIASARVMLNNMAMREGSRAHDPWFGRVDLTRGKVRPGEPLILSGDVDTTMRDGRPLIAFFAAETDLLPAWARSLVTLNALHATGQFRLGRDRIEIDGLHARGQSVEVRGRLRKQGLKQWGDMLVSSRGQEVGVALRGTRVEFRLIGAAAWFRNQLLNPQW
ncbi:MAG: hypothetical protein IRZ16_18440 [Myxococcaceae bacterium]|nr:hypothetical protein [Myxococcaceae bacterium]